jgi:hypothetical protein
MNQAPSVERRRRRQRAAEQRDYHVDYSNTIYRDGKRGWVDGSTMIAGALGLLFLLFVLQRGEFIIYRGYSYWGVVHCY